MEVSRIREVRKLKNVTQEELSKKLGINRTTLSKYESGQIDPSMNMIKRIATVLEVDPCSLMDWDTASDYFFAGINGKIRMKRIEKAFGQLNDEGQIKAVERVEELAEVPRFRNAEDLTQPPDIGPLSDEEDEQLFPRDPELEEELRILNLQEQDEREQEE